MLIYHDIAEINLKRKKTEKRK